MTIGSIQFGWIQKLLTPDWNDAGLTNIAISDTERTIHGIDALAVDELDVVFFGSSHVYCGVSPMELYKNYGILSYVMATAQQPVAGSYFLLEKIYETHCPQTVVLDVSTMFSEVTLPYWRYILDNLEFGALKYRMAKEYLRAGMATGESDGLFSVMFPIIKYHSRWVGITKDNFQPKSRNLYTNGQHMINRIVSSPYSIEDVMYETQMLSDYHSGMLTESADGVFSQNTICEALYTPSVTEENLKFLKEIRRLCEEHGSRLLLIKIPTMQVPQWYEPAWTPVKSSIISSIAADNNLLFLDMLYGCEPLVSFVTDTLDWGCHLNSFGAKKISDYLGGYLLENNLAESRSSLLYSEFLQKYEKVYSMMELQTTDVFGEYIDMLRKRKNDSTILIAAADDYISGLTPEDYGLLKELGLELIDQGGGRDSYVGVISEGKTIYEAVSDYEIAYQAEIANVDVEIHSRNGWMKDPGASVTVDRQEYAMSQIGLNFVVYDHETGLVIDSVVFNTYDMAKYCSRDYARGILLLRDYESALCFDGW